MNNKVPDNTIIMGIDPGTNITGFGVIRIKNFFIGIDTIQNFYKYFGN